MHLHAKKTVNLLIFVYVMLQFTKAYCGLFNEAGLPPKRQLTCFAVTPDAAVQPGQLIHTIQIQKRIILC